QVLCPRLADHALLEEYLRCLREGGGSAFARIRENPSFAKSFLSPEPARVEAITWDGKTARGAGGESFLEFDLPQPQYLAGMLIRYRLTAGQPTYFQMTWRRDADADYPDVVSYDRWPFPHGEGTMLVYIADTVQQFRIYPDLAPFAFRIEEITLLT